MLKLTINDESFEGLKFGESAKKSIWGRKFVHAIDSYFCT